ncbi:MAG: CotH kinase family protein, partial [Anaerolineales bacterium]|nr:CotH kinase family protein [Anaerolineales bacterium]
MKQTTKWLMVIPLLLLVPLWVWEHAASPPTDATSATLHITPASGRYDADVLVRLETAVADAQILFTLDGQTPLPGEAAVYQHPIPIDANIPGVTVVTARLLLADGSLGPLQHATYATLDSSLPIVSLIVAPDDLYNPQHGLYTNPRERGDEWERPVDVTYLDNGETAVLVGFHAPAGLRIHGNNSRDYDKKSWRLYFRSEYGLNRLTYPLFTPLPNQPPSDSFKRLVLHSGGQEFAAPGWTYLRTPLLEWLGAQTHVIVAPSRPVLLFINGEAQGIYTLRQRIDEWFFADVYGVEMPDEATQAAQWDALWQHIDTHDMQDAEAYAYVTSRIDVDNFIDYHILQLYAANTDWIYANVREVLPDAAGGRWHWLFWDLDWVFALSLGSSADFNMMTRFFEPESPDFAQGSLPLRKLMENAEFEARFLARVDELLNTVLRPEVVANKIEALAADVRPDVAYEFARWPSTTDWEASVAEMVLFAQERPSFFRQHIIEQFQLTGSAPLHLAAPASGDGQLALNAWLLPPVWTGEFFLDSLVTVTAVPAPGYRFAGWVEADLPETPVITLPVTAERSFTPRFERADAGSWQVGDVVITRAGTSDHPDYDIVGDWVELEVQRRGGVDLRGWRLTDGDTKTAVDEGSLVFAPHEALADVARGTRILVVVTENAENGRLFPQDDWSAANGEMVFYVGNGWVGGASAFQFHLGAQEAIALLGPGASPDFADDMGIAFF